MKIEFIKDGDIFESETDMLVNPVNCVGVQGAGLAYQFKKRFPWLDEVYKARCNDGTIVPGAVYVVWARQPNLGMPFVYKNKPPFYIAFFPTKDHWKDPSKLEYISDGMDDLIEQFTYNPHIQQLTEKEFTVAIPALGSGLGGLNWDDVRTIIVDKLENSFIANYNIIIKIYEPQ